MSDDTWNSFEVSSMNESSKTCSNDSSISTDNDECHWYYKDKQYRQQIMKMQQYLAYQQKVIHRLHTNFEYAQYHRQRLQFELDKKECKKWKSLDSMQWIINQDVDRFIKYEDALLSAVVLEEIDGINLLKMKNGDLKQIGITQPHDRQFLLQRIEQLKE